MSSLVFLLIYLMLKANFLSATYEISWLMYSLLYCICQVISGKHTHIQIPLKQNNMKMNGLSAALNTGHHHLVLV